MTRCCYKNNGGGGITGRVPPPPPLLPRSRALAAAAVNNLRGDEGCLFSQLWGALAIKLTFELCPRTFVVLSRPLDASGTEKETKYGSAVLAPGRRRPAAGVAARQMARSEALGPHLLPYFLPNRRDDAAQLLSSRRTALGWFVEGRWRGEGGEQVRGLVAGGRLGSNLTLKHLSWLPPGAHLQRGATTF